METRANEQYETLRKLLADGEWHDYSTILRQVMDTVPFPLAIRKCEQVRAASSAKKHGVAKPRMKPLSREQQIRAGQRIVAVATIQVKSFELKPPGRVPRGEQRWIRLRPRNGQVSGFPAPWTAAVLEALADNEWHNWEDVVAIGVALVPEERALRWAEAHRGKPSTGQGKPRPRSKADKIRGGARGVVVQALTENIRLLIERDENRKATRVRLRRPTDA